MNRTDMLRWHLFKLLLLILLENVVMFEFYRSNVTAKY
jgi:hypothetical protein